MQSLRRKNVKVFPVSIVRSSLSCHPVTSIVTSEAPSFSDVLVKAISAPREIDWAHPYQDEPEAPLDASAQAQPQKESVSPVTSWSPNSNNSTDLYVQLDILLRNKSLLIGVA